MFESGKTDSKRVPYRRKYETACLIVSRACYSIFANDHSPHSD